MDEIRYKAVTEIVSDDFERLSDFIKKTVSDEKIIPSQIFREEITSYLTGASKRIRSALIFLFSHLFYEKVDENTIKLAAAVEIIHNATLIHDDIIDRAQIRRGKATFHTKYDTRLAIIAGDFLLSIAISILSELKELEIINNFTKCLVALCRGEVEQYFAKNTTPTLEQYLEKSEAKTSSLFAAALTSLAVLNSDTYNKDMLQSFAKHFGRAFQLRDDLSNFLDEDLKKPLYADLENGIYTAPVIFAFGEKKDLKCYTSEEIFEKSTGTGTIKFTENLLNSELNASCKLLSQHNNNPYCRAITDICTLLKK